MSMDKKNYLQAVKATAREQRVAALREGRKERATVIPNKRKVQDKKACRKGQW